MSPVQVLENSIREKEAEVLALRQALKILSPITMPAEPSVAPPPAPLQDRGFAERTAEPAPSIPKPTYTGPRCSACQGKMYGTYRTMPSGAVVNLMKCNDSACGNEVYQ